MKFRLLTGNAYAPGLDVAEALFFIEKLRDREIEMSRSLEVNDE
jgi:hypothetical protein